MRPGTLRRGYLTSTANANSRRDVGRVRIGEGGGRRRKNSRRRRKELKGCNDMRMGRKISMRRDGIQRITRYEKEGIEGV